MYSAWEARNFTNKFFQQSTCYVTPGEMDLWKLQLSPSVFYPALCVLLYVRNGCSEITSQNYIELSWLYWQKYCSYNEKALNRIIMQYKTKQIFTSISIPLVVRRNEWQGKWAAAIRKYKYMEESNFTNVFPRETACWDTLATLELLRLHLSQECF